MMFSCQEVDLPQANFDLDEVAEFAGTAGDEKVDLTWNVVENSRHTGFRLSWTPGDETAELDKDVFSYCIEQLSNGENYEISIQAVYGKVLSGPKKISVKPESERLAVNNFTALAGDEMVKLMWVNPNDKALSHKIIVSPGNQEIVEGPEKNVSIVRNLVNGEEYTFSIVSVYEKGESPVVRAVATPGDLEPAVVMNKYVKVDEHVKVMVNEMYFLEGDIESCAWNLGDGRTMDGKEIEISYPDAGLKKIEFTVKYTDGNTATESLELLVIGWKWRFIFGDNHPGITIGYGKVSSTVFSPDGKTAYMPIAGSEGGTKNGGYLFAVDAETGEMKWVFDQTGNQTYGGGAAVADDGTIVIVNRDKNVYAINPDGSLKWKYTMAAAVNMAFPAIAKDGAVYAMDNATNANLYCIAADGSLVWKRTLEGREGCVVIDRDGFVYAGTSTALYKIDPSNHTADVWKIAASLSNSGCPAFGNNGYIYVPQRDGKGLMSVNMQNGESTKFTESGMGHCWSPVIGPDGTIYFSDSALYGTLFAVNPDMSLKWKYSNPGVTAKDAGNFITPAIGKGNILYIGTGKIDTPVKCSKVMAMRGDDMSILWEFEHSWDGRFFAASTIGPDGVWYGTTVGNAANYSPSWLAMPVGNELDTDCWSCRGGNWQGNNRQK